MRITVDLPGTFADCPMTGELLQQLAHKNDPGAWTLATAIDTAAVIRHGAHRSLQLILTDPGPAWALQTIAGMIANARTAGVEPAPSAKQAAAAKTVHGRVRNALQGWADATWPTGSTVATPEGPQRVERNLILAASVRICTTAEGTSRSWSHIQLQQWENQRQDTPA